MPDPVYKIKWDETGEHTYETGVDRGVLYTRDSSGAYISGVAWNGLTSISESPSGAETTALYADNIKYLNLISAEEFGATIEAYTYPDEFALCDGSASLGSNLGVMIGQQERKTFGLCYRTKIGNDVDGESHGYKLHLIYGCLASPSQRQYQTVNDSPSAISFSWEVKTTPVNVTGKKPTAILTIDSTVAGSTKMAAIETVLYGTPATTAVTQTYKAAPSTYNSALTYYTRSGEGTELSPYAYTVSDSVTSENYNGGSGLYVVDVAGVDAAAAVEGRMPLPDEVVTIMTAAA